MPTLLRVDGFRFFFFSNEGLEPAHVHVEKADSHAKFWLDPIGLAHSTGLNSRALRRLRELVENHREEFLEKWHEHFTT